MSDALDVTAVTGRAVREVHRRFSRFVDREDLEQECWVWMLEHPGRIEKFRADPEVGIASNQMYFEVSAHLDKYSRQCKLAALGYEPDDEAFYTRRLVLETLPFVIAGEYERQSEQHEISAKSDPALGGDFLATVLDVSRAWELSGLTPDEYDLLVAYSDGASMRDVAGKFGIDVSTVSRRVNRALDKMVLFLGGHEPRCGDGCSGCRVCSYGSRRPNVHSPESGINQIAG